MKFSNEEIEAIIERVKILNESDFDNIYCTSELIEPAFIKDEKKLVGGFRITMEFTDDIKSSEEFYRKIYSASKLPCRVKKT